MNAIVVGAGFGGIAAALRLRAKGYEVTIIDRCSGLGGRAQVFERNGFKHDAGPTVITAPFLFDELFALFGEKFSDHVKLVPLTPWYRFRFSDNTHFDYGGTLDETLAEIARIEPDDCAGYRNLLIQSEKIFNVGFVQLSAKPFHRFITMFRQIPALLRLRSQDTVWQLVCRYLKNPKLRQAFSIQPLLVGGNPFNTTSIYGLIHYLERAHGVHFAMGGTASITRAFGNLMQRQGINIQLNTTVQRIDVDGGVATGVTLTDGSSLRAKVIVSNGDPAFVYTRMIEPKQVAASVRLKLAAAEYSMGLFVLYFGTTRQYPNVAHHTIWLGERYKELLADIFQTKILSDDFSLYLHRPTATDTSFAPPGCDSFYVLCPVPNLKGAIDWSVHGPKLQARMVAALDQSILPGLSQCITSDFYMTPENFRDDYLSMYGAGFSVAPLFRQSAWFRFHNRSEGIRNLYLVGAGTHPGAGLPGVLCSAKVIESMVPDAHQSTQLVKPPKRVKLFSAPDCVLARKGKSFHWARRFMAKAYADPTTRLYEFFRHVDDVADEPNATLNPRAALEKISSDLSHGSSSNQIVGNMIMLLEQYKVNPAIALIFMAGVASDLNTVQVTDKDSLLRYCYQVAGTVGEVMCSVLGCRDMQAISHAIDLGIAMQLTNICRDVAADAAAHRRYLPASMVGDITPSALVNPATHLQPQIQACIKDLLDTADMYYQSGEAGLAYLPVGARSSILIAARVYRAIGTKLRAQNYKYWLGRTFVPQRTKNYITLSVLVAIPFMPRFWFLAKNHDAALHSAFFSLMCPNKALINHLG